jgi:vitamin B12 transporter
MRSPNTWPGRFLSPGAVARAEREFFIAIVKQDIRMISHLLPGRHGVRHLSIVATLLLTASVYSQTDPGSLLDPYTVIATRTPADVRTLGAAVDLISAADLSRQQITTPAAALGEVPGVPAFANGAIGADVSVFSRGSDSDQTLFLVDGIRLNDANTDYSVYLGGAQLGATDTIEIARGPQSTLYGSEAVGGVISIQAQKGSGAPSGDVSFEAGSFGSVSGQVDTQGAQDNWAWSLTGSGSHTDNDRPNNVFNSGNVVLRIDRDLPDGIDLGATLRGFVGKYGDPGDIFTNDPYAYETESNWLATTFADFKSGTDWTAHVTVGGQDRRYVSFDELPGVFTSTTVVQNNRGVLDALTTYSGLDGQRITAGVTAERETTEDDGYGDIDRHQTLLAAFAEDEWHPIKSVYLTGGVRYDDFDTFGSSVTGRATLAWLSDDRSFKLRASYGSGFNAPSFLELYGVATGYMGNPDLQPERSKGGDAGFDWYLPNSAGTFSATWFRNDFRNLIVYNFNVSPGTTENVGQASTDGVELEAKLKLLAGIELHASYTYLDADDNTDQTRLLRRPRNSGSADLWRPFGRGFSAGAGIQVVGNREDVDAETFLDVADPGYAAARVYAEWRATSRLALKARIENLLDKKYQPVNGYPALGFGAFGGLEWKL